MADDDDTAPASDAHSNDGAAELAAATPPAHIDEGEVGRGGRGEGGAVAKAASPSAPQPPSHLLTHDKHQRFIARVDRTVQRRNAQVVSAIGLAADINDDGSPVDPAQQREADGRPVGWTHRQYRVARDARMPLKTQPGYLSMAVRVHESYKRADDKPQAPVLNAETIQVYVDQRVYPVRDVTEE